VDCHVGRVGRFERSAAAPKLPGLLTALIELIFRATNLFGVMRPTQTLPPRLTSEGK
jgi:hypothetical protein